MINNLGSRITALEDSIDARISAHLNAMPLTLEAEAPMKIEKNTTNNKWTIKYDKSTYELIPYTHGNFTPTHSIVLQYDPINNTMTCQNSIVSVDCSAAATATVIRASFNLPGNFPQHTNRNNNTTTQVTQEGRSCVYSVTDTAFQLRTTSQYDVVTRAYTFTLSDFWFNLT